MTIEDLTKEITKPTCPRVPTKPLVADPMLYRNYADMLEDYRKKHDQFIKDYENYTKAMAERREHLRGAILEEMRMEDNDLTSKIFHYIWLRYSEKGLFYVGMEFTELLGIIKEHVK